MMAYKKSTSILLNDECSFDPIQKIWSGPKKPLKYGPDCSLGKVLLEKLLEQGDHICLINCDTGKHYTSREVADMAVNIARNFKKLGLKQGEIVGFCGTNTDYSGPFAIGAYLSGIVVNALEPNVGIDGIKNIFSITKPSLIFVDGKAYKNFETSLLEIDLKSPIYTMIDHMPGVPAITELLQGEGYKEDYQPETVKEGYLQTATIVCSSGSTGAAKVINVTHGTLLNCHSIQYSQENDRFLNYSSLHWVTGVYALTVPILGNSTRLITRKSFDAEEFFDIVQVYKPTVISMPPGYLALICASPRVKTTDLSSINLFFCGGNPLSPSIVAKIKPYFPNAEVMNSYGMTESPILRIALGYASNNGAIGKLTNNTEMKIIDYKGNCLGPNETGELCVKTVLPFTGYYNNPKANAEIYKNGWVLTGDIGFMDDDGILSVVDRKKDVIEFNGTQFYPSDIESVILKMPEVAEVCVAAMPSFNSSHIPAIIVIVLKHGFSMDEDYVYKYVSNKIPNFGKLEGGINFVNQIPKTASGKNLRRKLQYFVGKKS